MSAPSPRSPNDQQDTLDWVDALRGIAILMVMASHCFYGELPWQFCRIPVAKGVMAGQYGVQLFFVASAFTLACSWHRRKAEAHPVRNYFIRRFFRIAPLYAAGVLAYTALAFGLPHWNLPAENYTWVAVAANLLFLHGWLPFAQNCIMPGGWSIGIEMSFYLLVPWLAARLRRCAAAAGAMLLATCLVWPCAWGAHMLAGSGLPGAGLGKVGWPVGNNSFLYFWLPSQLPVFLLGFLAYTLLNARTSWQSVRPKIASAALIGLSLLVLWGMVVFSMLGDSSAQPPCFPLYNLFAPSLAGIAACCLTLALALHPWRFFVNRFTLFLGKLSYSLYIAHFIGAWLVAPWIWAHLPWSHMQPWGTLGAYAAGLAGCLAFSIPAAMATHRFVEKPGMAAGKRLIQRWA